MTKPKLYFPCEFILKSTVPASWHFLLFRLQEDLQKACLKQDEIEVSETCFKISDLCWFIRIKLNIDVKIPLPCTEDPVFKHRGILLSRISDLITACYLKGTKESLYYENSVDWLSEIILENIVCMAEGNNKTDGIEETKKQNALLRAAKNPFNQQKYLHTWRFTKSSIDWSEERTIEENNLKPIWLNFLKQKSQLTRIIENSKYIVPVNWVETIDYATENVISAVPYTTISKNSKKGTVPLKKLYSEILSTV